MNKVIVNNKRRVSKFLGIDVNYEDDLLEIKECENFINENKEYLETLNKEKMQEFFDKTGLNIVNVYVNSSNPRMIYFNRMGNSINNPLSHNIFNHDLLILTEANDLVISGEKIYVDDSEIYDLSNDSVKSYPIECHIRYKLSVKNNIEEQLEIIKEFYPQYNFNSKGIKQIFLSPFGDLFILDNNGNLFCNNKKYEENVEHIFCVDSYNAYLIFKNNRIEYLTSNDYQFGDSRILDKVLYTNTFLAMLKDKTLSLKFIDNNPGTSIHQIYNGVDDISIEILDDYYIDNEILTIYIGKEKLTIDNCSMWVDIF